jgi:hypothetical protein
MKLEMMLMSFERFPHKQAERLYQIGGKNQMENCTEPLSTPIQNLAGRKAAFHAIFD